MNTLLAGRNFAQEIFQEIGQFLRAMRSGILRADAGRDDASTGFSWPRGL